MWFWHCYTRFLLHLTNHRCGSDITIRGFCNICLIIDVVLTLLYAVFATLTNHRWGSEVAIPDSCLTSDNHRSGYDNAIRCFCYIRVIIDVILTSLYEIFVISDCGSDIAMRGFCYIWLIIGNCIRGFCYIWLIIDVSDIAIRGFCNIWLIIDVVLTLLSKFLLHLTNHRWGSDIYARFLLHVANYRGGWYCYTRFLSHLNNHRGGSDNAIRCFCYIRVIIDVVLTSLYEILVTSD